jgi:hypothetical protein
MVLARGRGYDQIAEMLSIDRAGVRDRALAALDAIGPETSVPDGRRQLITDYLLGQLPKRVADRTREELGSSPTERAWARVVASELAPLASGPLPEIPAGAVEPSEVKPADAEPGAVAEETPVAPAAEQASAAKAPEDTPVAAPSEAEPTAAEAKAQPEPTAAGAAGEPAAHSPRRVSRLGGAILLAGGAAVVIAIIVIFAVTGSSNKHHVAATPTTPTTSATTTTSASGTTARPVAQINLLAPGGSKSTAGIAEVLKQGTKTAIAIVGQGLPANSTHNAYAVWLYNAPSDAVRLGFVNPGVGKNGRLETTGPLPTNASHFKQLLLSLETTANPKQPGQVVLQGNLTGV